MTHNHQSTDAPNPRTRRLGVIFFACVVLAVLSWLFFNRKTMPDQLAPRSVAELQALDDKDLVAEVSSELSRRLYAKGFDLMAWQQLAGPPRHVYVIASVEAEILRTGLGTYLAETSSSTCLPHLDDLVRAYQEIGLPGAAEALAAASVRLTQYPDPTKDQPAYVNLHARFLQQTKNSGAQMTIYARKHLAEFSSISLK